MSKIDAKVDSWITQALEAIEKKGGKVALETACANGAINRNMINAFAALPEFPSEKWTAQHSGVVYEIACGMGLKQRV